MTDANPTNAYEFTVSELAGAVKRNIEDQFGHVRVRGELGRVTIARSGHVYMDLKDERAVISSIIWKGVASSLPFKPEEGLEVIAEGKLSTYPGRSQYQLIISRLEPAGEGALMALLEERKRKLTKEGLFHERHKTALPFLPRIIGVVTSPTGAVIRDILHRIRDRFPVHVLLWPVLVQGDKAAPQVAAAIRGFNALPRGGEVPRPDLLIVARGGGSVEDLWAFNEEEVVRAAFECEIPLISAIGHETDWSLLDLVADMRAPTPTGAAEMAVPVRGDLLEQVASDDLRLKTALRRLVRDQETKLRAASRGLPKLDDLLAQSTQRFDHAASNLSRALQMRVERAAAQLATIFAGLRPGTLRVSLDRNGERLTQTATRLQAAMTSRLDRQRDRLASSAKLLQALSHKSVLGRGFALVRSDSGQLLTRAAQVKPGQKLELEFADGRKDAVASGHPRARKPKTTEPEQGDLF